MLQQKRSNGLTVHRRKQVFERACANSRSGIVKIIKRGDYFAL